MRVRTLYDKVTPLLFPSESPIQLGASSLQW
jgi:hypothetical protein